MANYERGEIEVVVNDKPYTLKLSMNASVALQQRTKRKIGELLADATALDFEAIRDLVFMLLQKHHGKEIDTLSKAGEFIDDAGGVHVFFDTLGKLGAANAPEDPQKAQETPTGESSTATPVASA